MPGEAAGGAEGTPVLRTLADKVNWLIEQAHPAGRGPYTNTEVADLIKKTTGEEISYTQIWKLRNGQAQNPQMRLIEAMAKTFGVPAAFFFPEFDEKQAGLLQQQVELLAMIRDADIDAFELRTILGLSPQARKAITDLIAVTVGDDARRRAGQDEAD
jgi:transcriptional regulator with XRE-family HTH domain